MNKFIGKPPHFPFRLAHCCYKIIIVGNMLWYTYLISERTSYYKHKESCFWLVLIKAVPVAATKVANAFQACIYNLRSRKYLDWCELSAVAL